VAVSRELNRGGIRLAYRDFGGAGPAVLLLHGLAGHAGEWAQTASWLISSCRVLAPDSRGHGNSERVVEDVSRQALVSDVAFVIEELEIEPAVVVGQSLGGLTALSLAASRPELTRGLVLVDATPDGGGEGIDDAVGATIAALASWPVPFPSSAEAQMFFGARFGQGLAAEAWTNGLQEGADGWRPRFDLDVMARTMHEAIGHPSWEAWEQIECPVLIVRAGNGMVEPATAAEMVRRLPHAQLVEIADAAHDVHLDKPDAWRKVLSHFVDSVAGPRGPQTSPQAAATELAS
jgi:pimeloyl-ACP methyl ester carboxylesterase